MGSDFFSVFANLLSNSLDAIDGKGNIVIRGYLSPPAPRNIRESKNQNRNFLVGDVVGGEIKAGMGFLSDTDGDGKADIVPGGREESNARIIVLNGRGELILDSSFLEMINADTYPQFCLDGNIYFTAYSAYHIVPKVAGAFNVREKQPSWLHHSGPLPLSLNLSDIANTAPVMAVSNRATGRERIEVATPYHSDHKRHAILLLDDSGGEIAYVPFGAETREGYFVDGQISGVQEKLFDINGDGNPEVLILIERVSELYEGPALFRITDQEGNILRELEEPEKTGGSFGFFKQGDDIKIAILWKRTGDFLLVDGSLSLLNSRKLPGDIHNAELRQIGDLNGDGKTDLGSIFPEQPAGLFAYTGDGRLILNKPFSYGYDTNVHFMGWMDDSMAVNIVTGYLLHPRGVYSLDPLSGDIEFFYPTAGMIPNTIPYQGKIFCSYYAPNNGAELVHENGMVERDTELFLHVIDRGGDMHPFSKPYPDEDNDGGIEIFLFDYDSDGVREPHFIIQKDGYYKGIPKIFRFEEDGSLTELYKGPENAACRRVQVIEAGGREYLVVSWRKYNILEVFNGGFEVIYRHTCDSAGRFRGMVNLDGDGKPELMEKAGGRLQFLDLDREILAEYSMQEDTLGSMVLSDLDGDGKEELIMRGEKSIEVFGY